MSEIKDPPSADPLAIQTEPLKVISLPTAVLSLDASADGSRLFAACLDGGIYEVNPESEASALIGKHKSYASGVACLPDSTVISSGYDGALQWHDSLEHRTFRRIQAHDFWSWQMAVSHDARQVASVTGQYLCGGYKYEPLPEREPSVKVFDARTAELLHAFSHVPPVQAVAFSPEGRFLAAGNLMGEVRVWDLDTGHEAARWTTPAFTSWGIIKSHCYIGGIYAMAFTPDSGELLVGGMGPIRDPMAGNGKQTWQRFAWRETPARQTDEIHEGEHGGGFPESLLFHPSRRFFVMAGRLAQGKWNTGFFDAATGSLIHSLDAKNRITKAVFNADGTRLFLAGATGQSRKKEGSWPKFGRISIYHLTT